MIEVFMEADPPCAKGLTPGQLLRVHMPDGKVWNLTRFGAECIARCTEEEKT